MKLIQKNFYFIRHGESEQNVNPLIGDEVDVSLTPHGKKQAESLSSLMEALPIKTICVSPLKRALQTKNIAIKKTNCPVIVIEELRECTTQIWLEMTDEKQERFSSEVQNFIKKTLLGVNQALKEPGPVIIFAHGGIHFALCHYLNIKEHDKKIDHCVPIHFYPTKNSEWQVELVKFNIGLIR